MEAIELLKQYAKGQRDFKGVSYIGKCFKSQDLSEAYLLYANLPGANLKDANLKDAHLLYADFSGANLSDANLSGVNLSNANLSDSNLKGVNLKDVHWNEETDWSGAQKLETTVNIPKILIEKLLS